MDLAVLGKAHGKGVSFTLGAGARVPEERALGGMGRSSRSRVNPLCFGFKVAACFAVRCFGEHCSAFAGLGRRQQCLSQQLQVPTVVMMMMMMMVSAEGNGIAASGFSCE